MSLLCTVWSQHRSIPFAPIAGGFALDGDHIGGLLEKYHRRRAPYNQGEQISLDLRRSLGGVCHIHVIEGLHNTVVHETASGDVYSDVAAALETIERGDLVDVHWSGDEYRFCRKFEVYT